MTPNKQEMVDFFDKLTFKEEKHEYFVDGKKLNISVSGKIKSFYIPFDEEKISKQVAARRNVTQKEILVEWKAAKDLGCDEGNQTHIFGELYVYDRGMKPTTKLEEAVVKFWKDLPEHIIPVVLELKMYHKELFYAGTADILLFNTKTGTYIIGDYKTNKDLFKNFKDKKMLAPFETLLDCPFNKYQIQLSYYQILFEQLGFNVSSRKIIWLKRDGSYQVYDAEDLTKKLKKYELTRK